MELVDLVAPGCSLERKTDTGSNSGKEMKKENERTVEEKEKNEKAIKENETLKGLG